MLYGYLLTEDECLLQDAMNYLGKQDLCSLLEYKKLYGDLTDNREYFKLRYQVQNHVSRWRYDGNIEIGENEYFNNSGKAIVTKNKYKIKNLKI